MGNRNERQISLLNLSLAIIVVLSAVYIGFQASNQSSGTKSSIYNEARLSQAIYPGDSVNSLQRDLNQITAVVSQESDDQSLASQASNINNQTKLNTLSETKWLNQISAEVNALIRVNQVTKMQFRNEIKPLSTAIKSVPRQSKISQLSGDQSIQNLSFGNTTFDFLVQQITLLKVADDQQVGFELLNSIGKEVNAAIVAAASTGVNPTDFYADLTTLSEDDQAGQNLSASSEAQIITGRYNSKQVKSNLLTAERDMNAAVNAFRAIIDGLRAS